MELVDEYNHPHHHHKHQGLDPLIRSVSRDIAALANVFQVVQLIFFLAVCSCKILQGFGFVAFFVSVDATSFCIRHLDQYACNPQFFAYELFVLWSMNNNNNNNNNNNGVHSFTLTFKDYLLINPPPCIKCICYLKYSVPYI